MFVASVDDVVAICNACCDPVTLAGSRQIGPQGPIFLEPDDGDEDDDGEDEDEDDDGEDDGEPE